MSSYNFVMLLVFILKNDIFFTGNVSYDWCQVSVHGSKNRYYDSQFEFWIDSHDTLYWMIYFHIVYIILNGILSLIIVCTEWYSL